MSSNRNNLLRRAFFTGLFTLALATMGAPAHADGPKAEMPPPVDILLTHCLPALMTGKSPAAMATEMGLPEFAPEQAVKFAREGGRVFAIPAEEGNAVFITNRNFGGVCSVAVREADAARYRQALDKWLGPQSPFRLVRETRDEGVKQTRRDYRADIGAIPIVVFATIADAPRSDGIQILITAARVRKENGAKIFLR